MDLRTHAVVLELGQKAAAVVPQLGDGVRNALADLGQHRLERHPCIQQGEPADRLIQSTRFLSFSAGDMLSAWQPAMMVSGTSVKLSCGPI